MPVIPIKVKAGTNTCGICYNPGHFSLNIPRKPVENSTPYELLVCGHGICNDCYKQICERGPFNCPFCRREGNRLVRLGTGSEIGAEVINTFTEFLNVWENKEYLLANHGGRYMTMYREICFNKRAEILKQKEQAARLAKLKEKEEKKKNKENSRKLAVCKHCNRDTFTSLKQLQIHIAKKH